MKASKIQIDKAIRVGIALKRTEKLSNEQVTDELRSLYETFNKCVNGMSDDEKYHINTEVRKYNKAVLNHLPYIYE